MTRPLRVCLIASSRFAIREPFVGGLEAHTHLLARELGRRGHEVSLFAAPGSDPTLNVRELPVRRRDPSPAARADVGATPREWVEEHHAYLSLMLDLAASGGERFDVVHNNSLHYLPVAMAAALAPTVVTTLHTPPLAFLESAIDLAPARSVFVAVSDATGRAWAPHVAARTVHNGVDTNRWPVGPGGDAAVWSGRLVPEKAPHHAIIAARRAGMPLVLVGPCHDPAYFADEVAPRLGDGITYRGHVGHDELGDLLGRSRVAVVSPEWDEPYGLVAAEAMACGTPVAAYARGGLPEVVGVEGGALARPGDPDDLARAILEAAGRDRAGVRRRVEQHFSLEAMVDRYVEVYREAIRGRDLRGEMGVAV
ncbi:glycosyltransferase family 4 protein [Nocardioides daphniae]|uniref:Glycosyl transferase family 1 n=1 Tax=Nocardioides daphniae TaxID=402297 RepID=A0A4P7UFA6_9ACTN|nr:glycosyltransferase family 4 protein [Nocardioides daphniae]QCC77539.1 glycosyltransferase family 4 protein [Nocardioides daphniae]GGD30979.1 glycosyl transferase family 1 [Nocardioides daphniae]